MSTAIAKFSYYLRNIFQKKLRKSSTRINVLIQYWQLFGLDFKGSCTRILGLHIQCECFKPLVIRDLLYVVYCKWNWEVSLPFYQLLCKTSMNQILGVIFEYLAHYNTVYAITLLRCLICLTFQTMTLIGTFSI